MLPGSSLPLLRSLRIPRLALAADRQHEDDVHFPNITVECKVAARPRPNDQFPLAISCRVTDEWVLRQDIQGGNDFRDPLARILDLISRQVLKDAIEVSDDLGRKFDSGHVIGLGNL